MGEVSSPHSSSSRPASPSPGGTSLPSLLRVPLIIKMYVICGRACKERGRGKGKPQRRLAWMYPWDICIHLHSLYPASVSKTPSDSFWISNSSWQPFLKSALCPALAIDHSQADWCFEAHFRKGMEWCRLHYNLYTQFRPISVEVGSGKLRSSAGLTLDRNFSLPTGRNWV